MGPVCNSAALLWKAEEAKVGGQKYYRPCTGAATHDGMAYKMMCVLSLDAVRVLPLKWLSPGHLAAVRRQSKAPLVASSSSGGGKLAAGVWARQVGADASLTTASALAGFKGLRVVTELT